jgi:hypothetical protein
MKGDEGDELGIREMKQKNGGRGLTQMEADSHGLRVLLSAN